jgi:hypothetical protein
MVTFARCLPHAMGSPPRVEEVGEVMWPSPPHFFCLPEFLLWGLQLAERLLRAVYRAVEPQEVL